MSDWSVTYFIGKFYSCFITKLTVDVSTSMSYNRREGLSEPSVEILHVGAEMHAYTVRAEKQFANGAVEVGFEGPNTSFDIGIRSNVENSGLAAMAELSAAKAEVAVGPLYACGNLNANTGVKIGRQGLQVGLAGFGITLGVGGRWTIDTPFGSAGATTGTLMVTNGNKVSQRNRNYNEKNKVLLCTD